jgi:hypothetical protein
VDAFICLRRSEETVRLPLNHLGMVVEAPFQTDVSKYSRTKAMEAFYSERLASKTTATAATGPASDRIERRRSQSLVLQRPSPPPWRSFDPRSTSFDTVVLLCDGRGLPLQ